MDDNVRRLARDAKRKKTADSQDIGRIPDVADPDRREMASQSLKFFSSNYFPSYSDPWAPMHDLVCGYMEQAVLEGGLFALALPRGYGKTTMCEWLVIWSLLHAHRFFVVFIGATSGDATSRLDSIKRELETNDELLADYPEVCYPIRCLEGSVRRCEGQKHKGERTMIKWGSDEIALPTIEGSAASGSRCVVRGITGAIRGLVRKRADGTSIRPDLALPDDCQTRESAKSPQQTASRHQTILGDVVYLAGKQKIALVSPCTKIYEGDLACRLLDREMSPDFRGVTFKMLPSWPKNMDLWEKYRELRLDELKAGGSGTKAPTEFYSANREAMDEGAEVGWPERHGASELSGLQHAMDRWMRDPESFFAECQNEPREVELGDDRLRKDDVFAKVSDVYKQHVVPQWATKITSFGDVHLNAMYYVTVAWSDGFRGHVIDYGTVPEQRVRDFELEFLPIKLADIVEAQNEEGIVKAGVLAFIEMAATREYVREDGTHMSIDRILVDANWGPMTDVVYEACHETPHRNIVMPSHGFGLTASDRPMSQWPRKSATEQIGYNWRVPQIKKQRIIQHVTFDANFWKSFVRSRWKADMADQTTLSIYGTREPVRDHDNFASHQVGEYSVRTRGRGREVDEFKLKPTNPDNHWWDCVVGNCVAASMAGCAMAGFGVQEASRGPVPRSITSANIHEFATR